jgi:hypothetical protein
MARRVWRALWEVDLSLLVKYLRHPRVLALCLAALTLPACSGQSSTITSSLWPGSLFHHQAQVSAPPPAAAATPQQHPREAKLDTPDTPDTAEPVEVSRPRPPVRKAPPETEQEPEVPKALVTSTMNDANRQEAEQAISEVNKRLALAQNADPGVHGDGQIDVVRKLVDNAQQAYQDQDYLTARSLAQKASVLASHLPAPGDSQSSH